MNRLTDAQRRELQEKLRASVEYAKAMSPAAREAMIAEQAKSARSCAPCEHGVRDWETCADCRRTALAQEGGRDG